MLIHKKYGKWIAVFLLICASVMLCACTSGEGTAEKLRDLDFTVVQETELPEQLKLLIEDKKTNPFKLTYTNSEYLYIVQGYGAQQTGGYSTAVKELWLGEDGIYFTSELLGPGENEEVAQVITYPFIVIKTELLDESVIFQ